VKAEATCEPISEKSRLENMYGKEEGSQLGKELVRTAGRPCGDQPLPDGLASLMRRLTFQPICILCERNSNGMGRY